MAANSSQTITLKLKVKTKGVDTLSLVAKPDANLVVSLSEQPLAVPVNGHVEVPVTVQTGDNGRYYLMLQPTLHNQTGSLQANAVGVAIQVGPRQAQNKVSATAERFLSWGWARQRFLTSHPFALGLSGCCALDVKAQIAHQKYRRQRCC